MTKRSSLAVLVSFLVFSAVSPAGAEEWSRAYINALPDSAFAVIEKTSDGKALRHLPHHDATGAVDTPHLKSARARLKQVKWADSSNEAKARDHLEQHWQEFQRELAKSHGLSGPVDLNRARIEDLMRLPKIGEKTARAIVNYREAKGGFKTVNELLLVRGIGKKTFEAIEDLVAVE